MTQPEAIVLTGPSSSGKSAVSRELLGLWERPALVLDADQILQGFNYDRFGTSLARTLNEGLFRAASAFLEVGLSVIVEQVFWGTELAVDAAEVLDGRKAWLICLHCDLETAEEREASRDDREVGTTRRQRDLDWAALPADLSIDTSSRQAKDVAHAIQEFCTKERPHGFRALARKVPNG